MSRHLEIEAMYSPFERVMTYLQVNYIDLIGQRGLAVYGALFALVQQGEYNPEYQEVGDLAGCGESSVRFALDDLCRHNILVKVVRFDRRGRKLSNLYKLTDPDDWTRNAIETNAPLTEISAMSDTETTTHALTGYNDVEFNASTSGDVVMRQKPTQRPTSHARASVAVTLFDLTTETTEDRALNTRSLSSLSKKPDPESARDNARVREPAPEEAKPVAKGDNPFGELLRYWQRNIAKLNEHTEDTLWNEYVKHKELVLEAVKEAVSSNNRGDRPSLKYVMVILESKVAQAQADEARALAIAAANNPELLPDNGAEVFETDPWMNRLYQGAKERKTTPEPTKEQDV